MKAISLRKMVIAVLIIGAGTSYVCADIQELQAKLSKEATFEFKDVTIAQALENIGQKAEVKIVLSDEAVWKLPFGEATRMSASLSGPLADSLSKMLIELFMRYAVGDDKITIYPRQELEHILGRPNAEQLKLLKKIYSLRIDVKNVVSDVVFKQIKESLGAPSLSFVPYYVTEDICKLLNSIGSRVSLVVVLEQAGLLHGTPIWYLSGMDFPDQSPVIRMINEEDYREAKLDQVVDISFKDETADVILQRLAGWTGMELFVSKGDTSWLKEEIVVNMQNITLRQALLNIVNTVDGETHIGDNYIEIKGPVHLQKVAAPAKPKSSSAGEGYVGKISIPMGEGESKYYIEFMLRESDLTEELKKLREDKIKEILRKFSKAGDKAPKIAARPQSYSNLN